MAESIFTTQVPGTPDAADGTAYTLATLFSASADGHVTGIRWRFPNTLPSGPVIGVLYQRTNDVGGTELARATFSSPTAGAWNVATFGTPVNVTAGQLYYAAVYTPDRYVATAGLFASAGITNGHLTAPADDTTTPARNGRFYVGGADATYPNNQSAGGCYFADVVFQPAGPNTADGAGALAATGTLTAGGTVQLQASADLAAASSLAAAARRLVSGAAALSATGIALAQVTGATVPRPYTGLVSRPNSGIVPRP